MSLINPPPLDNEILKAAEDKLESQLTPENRADYLKIVVAGMKTALTPKSDGSPPILATLQHSKDPLNDCASGAINLCLLMRRSSRGTMPLKAMVPAAMTLMLHALDFADKSGIMKIGQPELVKATHIFANLIFKRLGISPQMIHTAAVKTHALTQDPVAMEKMKRASGFVRDPNASTPTPLPEGADATAS